MEKVKCFKCGKKLDKDKSNWAYNSFFHKDCLKKFEKQADKELEKGLKEIRL